jgi:competence protein ComEC
VSTAGPLAALAALVVGILAGEAQGPDAAIASLLVAAVLLLAALASRDSRRIALVLTVAGCFLLGHAVMQRALDGLVHSPLAPLIQRRAFVDATATLVDDPAGPRFTVEVPARLDELDGRGAGERTVLVTGSGELTSALRVLEAGDRVTVRGTLQPLTGFDERYRWRHAAAELAVSELVDFSPPSSPLMRTANAARTAVLAGTDRLPPTERALLAGFLLGDTRSIPDGLVDDFRDSGLSHLLAVSGANVAFVLAIASPLLGRLRLGNRFLGGVTVLVLFGTMTRWEPSVLRACAMAAVAMTAMFLGRPVPAARILALAAIGLLVVDPFLVHSVGFLLSCGAAAGIIALSTRIARRIPGPRPLAEALGVTAAAQLGVLPVLLPVFGTVPLVALPANLLAAPVVGPLTVWGLVAGTVGGWTGPGIARVLQLPTYALLRWVELVATTAAAHPMAVDGHGVIGLLALTCLAAATLRAARGRAGRLRGDAPVPPR